MVVTFLTVVAHIISHHSVFVIQCVSEIWFIHSMPLFRFTRLKFLNYFSDFSLDWLFVLICCAS